MASLKGLERSPADVSPVRGDEQELISEMSEANKGKHPGRKTRREAAASLSHVASSPGAPPSKTACACESLSLRYCLHRLVLESLVLPLSPSYLRRLSPLPAPLAPSPSPLIAFTFIPLCLPAH